MTVRNVLFLCTHNSSRSIVAESILNVKGNGRFRGFSAGSSPGPHPNPNGLAVLAEHGHSTAGLSSKSWDIFAEANAIPMHIIITVCDDAAGESCPVWPGHPTTAHWGVADPSTVGGDAQSQRAAFRHAYDLLEERIDRLLSLPPGLDGDALKEALVEIGSTARDATPRARNRAA